MTYVPLRVLPAHANVIGFLTLPAQIYVSAMLSAAVSNAKFMVIVSQLVAYPVMALDEVMLIKVNLGLREN